MTESSSTRGRLTRRGFLKTAGAAAGVAGLAGVASMATADGWLAPASAEAAPEEHVARTYHQSHCGGMCSLACTVRDGRMVKVQPNGVGNPDFQTICLKDMAGTMSPYEAEHLIKGIKDAVGDVPLILHTHCTTGMAYMTVTKAIESGIDVIDCATSCFSNGTSQPSTETMFYALGQYGIETGLNEDVINKVNDYFKPIKQKYVDSGRISAKSMATDAQALVYKVPGGMLSNMIANLTDMKAMDKFDAALKEIPEVRKDLGYPPLVTPLSQMVGNQAVTNVLMGERYKIVSKEVQNYFRGQYGIAPAPVSESLQAKILGEGGKPVDCRIEDSKRTGEEFKAAKEALGELARSEEDVMSYICYPDQAMKFFEDRKAKEENICTYVIEEA